MDHHPTILLPHEYPRMGVRWILQRKVTEGFTDDTFAAAKNDIAFAKQFMIRQGQMGKRRSIAGRSLSGETDPN